MRYYRDVRNVNRKVDDVMKNLLENGGSIDVNLIVLNLSNMYPVSSRMIENRFFKWVEAYDDLSFNGKSIVSDVNSDKGVDER